MGRFGAILCVCIVCVCGLTGFGPRVLRTLGECVCEPRAGPGRTGVRNFRSGLTGGSK